MSKLVDLGVRQIQYLTRLFVEKGEFVKHFSLIFVFHKNIFLFNAFDEQCQFKGQFAKFQIAKCAQKCICKYIKITNWRYAQIIYTAGYAGQGFSIRMRMLGKIERDHPQKYICKYKKQPAIPQKYICNDKKQPPKILQSHCQHERVCQIFDIKCIQ